MASSSSRPCRARKVSRWPSFRATTLDDPRLREASTLAPRDCARIWSFFQDGGAENMRALLGLMASLIGMPAPWRESARIESAGYCNAARRTAGADARRALLVFYRSLFLSDDLRANRRARRRAFRARSGGGSGIRRQLEGRGERGVSARGDRRVQTRRYREHDGLFGARALSGGALDLADAPVLQAALATSTREAWAASKRGANGADLAMNIVLPEVDGRIFTRAISFKAPAGALLASQFAQTRHAPEPTRIAFVARARRQLGRVAPQGEPRKKPRADFIGLPRAARTRRLRHRARYASERRGDCRGVERGGLRFRRIEAAARSDARA